MQIDIYTADTLAPPASWVFVWISLSQPMISSTLNEINVHKQFKLTDFLLRRLPDKYCINFKELKTQISHLVLNLFIGLFNLSCLMHNFKLKTNFYFQIANLLYSCFNCFKLPAFLTLLFELTLIFGCLFMKEYQAKPTQIK